MAEITLLTPEQLAERDRKPTGPGRGGRGRSPDRTRIIEEYKAALQQAQPGYGADVLLAPTEDKRIVRQNLKAAAEELNLALDFRPVRDRSRIHFRVITPEEQAARPKRSGRPRKNVPAEQPEPDSAGEQVQTLEPEPPAESSKKRTRKSRTSVSQEASA